MLRRILSVLCLLISFLSISVVHASTLSLSVSASTMQLMFPEIRSTDNLALDPGNTLETFLIAYFARLEGKIYSSNDARRYAISLGIIAPKDDMSATLTTDQLRQISYRHRLLFTDDPVVRSLGASPYLLEHITPKAYTNAAIIADHVRYYSQKLEDSTLPDRLRETLSFRRLRFVALQKAMPITLQGTGKLDVPYFKQERSLSCEMASLRSLLAYYGTEVEESMLISMLGVTEPLEYLDGIWGDPQIAFVGNINGTQSGKTGYGVYWKPTARVAQAFYPAIDWFENGSLRTLTESIDAGHPVLIWSVVAAKGGFQEISWTTPTGVKIVGFNGEHSWVVVGYAGPTDAPTSFSILDPYFGPKTVTAQELEKGWSRFDRSGIRWK
ncbi:hypothetical protein COW46_02755 [Candidatus Gracilibacteria bacterium CG17_big_fil_post_rev_8_21_14_2_50_48_13]|nr:MAG: hypothetical protein COW46_02755 [Candidatus Gracilibacteria bacterium CG17_big_fil_post_rev_8_21_14_2_50_48_13]